MKLVLYLAFFSYTCLYGDIIFENGKVTEIIDSTTFEYEFNYSVFEDRFRFGWRFVSDDPIPSPNRFKLKIKIACIKPSKEEGSQDIEGKEYLSKMILYKRFSSFSFNARSSCRFFSDRLNCTSKLCCICCFSQLFNESFRSAIRT